jgi:hypothetical protein
MRQWADTFLWTPVVAAVEEAKARLIGAKAAAIANTLGNGSSTARQAQ